MTAPEPRAVTPERNARGHAEPPPPLAASGVSGPLGSAAHVRQTLDRVAAGLADGRLRRARSEVPHARSMLLRDPQRASRDSDALRALLETSVTAFARRMREDAVPPERMLVLVKAAVEEVTSPSLDAAQRRELTENVVRWSIDGYYAA